MAIKIVKNTFQKGTEPESAETLISAGSGSEAASGASIKKSKTKPSVSANISVVKLPKDKVSPSISPVDRNLEEIMKVAKDIPAVETPPPASPLAIVPDTRVNAESIEKEAMAISRPSTPGSVQPAGVGDNAVRPILMKERRRRNSFGVIAAVLFLCVVIGYWFYYKSESDKLTQYASVPRVDITVPAVTVADKNPVPVTVPQKDPKVAREEEIKKFIDQWLTGWQSGDIKTYGACYAPDFESKGKNLDAWIAYKTNVFQKSKNISVTVDDLQISSDETSARAVFTQYYSSAINKDSGQKTLELKKINNEWKIYREIM